jgi:hypothetical protein
MAIRILPCAIEQIAEWHPELYLEAHIVAGVAVMRENGPPPCRMEVECQGISSARLGRARRFRLQVSWAAATEGKAERLRHTVQRINLVEMASIAVAMILATMVVDLGQLEVMRHGDRADYQSLAVPSVLEVSGTEMETEFLSRHREKVAQALANPQGLDAYVVVCAFAPSGGRIRFSYHRQEGN